MENEALKQVAIVGGRGCEGMRWGRILKSQGWMVHIVDHNDPIAIVGICSLVVLATSWRAVKEMGEIVDHIKPGTVFISVMGRMSKRAFELRRDEGGNAVYLCDLLLRKGVEIAFVHFMYASHIEDGRGQNVAVDDTHCSLINSQMVCALVASTGATIVPVTRDRHDLIASFNQQVLREFALAYAYAAQSREEEITLEDLFRLSTPLTRHFLAMSCRVLLQPQQLNEEITLDVDNVPEILSGLSTLKLLKSKRRQEERGKVVTPSSSEGFAEFFSEVSAFADGELAAELAKSLV